MCGNNTKPNRMQLPELLGQSCHRFAAVAVAIIVEVAATVVVAIAVAAAHFQFVFVVAPQNGCDAACKQNPAENAKERESCRGVKEMPFCCNWLADTHPLYVSRHLTSVLSGQFELPTPSPLALPLAGPHLLPFYQLLQIAKCLFGRVRLPVCLFVGLFVRLFCVLCMLYFAIVVFVVVALCFVMAPQKTHKFFNNILRPQNALWLIEIGNFRCTMRSKCK